MDEDFVLNLDFGAGDDVVAAPTKPTKTGKDKRLHSLQNREVTSTKKQLRKRIDDSNAQKSTENKKISSGNKIPLRTHAPSKSVAKSPQSTQSKAITTATNENEKAAATVKKVVSSSQPMSSKPVTSTTSKPFVPVAAADDPLQYHARPKDLSQNALAAPHASHSSTHIFSRVAFDSFGLDEKLVDLLQKPVNDKGFGLSTSTTVQSAALPALLKRHNAVIKSETGSGKTLAYLLPVMQDLMSAARDVKSSREVGTQALIIAPTRELCSQISDIVTKLTRCAVWIVGGAITGGEKRKSEKARLRKGVTVLVATPGRLMDHLKTTESFSLTSLRWLILDEADRLLDMGFEQTILDIVKHLRESHGNKAARNSQGITYVMASATLSPALKRLAEPVMAGASYEVIDADRKGDARAQDTDDQRLDVPEQLSQYFMLVTCKWRLAALTSFLRLHAHEKVMVFFATCDSVDYHALLLANSKWPISLDSALNAKDKDAKHTSRIAAQGTIDPLEPTFTGMIGDKCPMFRLHGNVPQKQRQEVYRAFCEAKNGVMFCTDVAARGLDLPSVNWILQYDPPCDTADYIHRIGRTARRGQGGSALLFLLPSEAAYLEHLRQHSVTPQALSLQNLFMDTSKHVPGVDKFKNIDEMTAVILQRSVESTVANNKFMIAAAKQAFRSFVRAYATHAADTKGIFRVQLLHLGHVAKSFALKESPTEFRGNDNVISKILNGECTASALKEAMKSKRAGFGEKRKPKVSGKDVTDGTTKKRKRSSSSSGDRLSESKKFRKDGVLSASGKFRTGGSYFNKKGSGKQLRKSK